MPAGPWRLLLCFTLEICRYWGICCVSAPVWLICTNVCGDSAQLRVFGVHRHTAASCRQSFLNPTVLLCEGRCAQGHTRGAGHRFVGWARLLLACRAGAMSRVQASWSDSLILFCVRRRACYSCVLHTVLTGCKKMQRLKLFADTLAGQLVLMACCTL